MEAVAVALEELDAAFYGQLACEYCGRRNLLHETLTASGFRAERPDGAYYILADYSGLSDLPDGAFARWLTTEVGVTPVPGSSFFSTPDPARRLVRFAFCKREDTLRQAAERLRTIR
jgi:aminotransferase